MLMALPALAIVAIEAALTIVATVIVVSYAKQAMEAQASLSGLVTALLGGIQKIKLAGAEDRAFAKWAHSYAAYARPTYGRPVLVQALTAIAGLVGLLGGIAIYYLAATSQVPVANYMAFNAAYGQVTAAIMALAAELIRSIALAFSSGFVVESSAERELSLTFPLREP